MVDPYTIAGFAVLAALVLYTAWHLDTRLTEAEGTLDAACTSHDYGDPEPLMQFRVKEVGHIGRGESHIYAQQKHERVCRHCGESREDWQDLRGTDFALHGRVPAERFDTHEDAWVAVAQNVARTVGDERRVAIAEKAIENLTSQRALVSIENSTEVKRRRMENDGD